MNQLHTNAVSRTAPRYNNNPVLPYKLHDNHTSRRSSFSSFADSETSEVSVFSQVSTISSISSVSSSGPTHATWQPRLNDAIPCAGYSGSSSHGITDTTRPRGISSFLNLGSYHEETDWAGVQLRSTLPTEDVRSTAAGPFQYYSANHSTNPRRSVTSQTWQKPSLVRQNDKRQILVEQLVGESFSPFHFRLFSILRNALVRFGHTIGGRHLAFRSDLFWCCFWRSFRSN